MHCGGSTQPLHAVRTPLTVLAEHPTTSAQNKLTVSVEGTRPPEPEIQLLGYARQRSLITRYSLGLADSALVLRICRADLFFAVA